MTDPSFFQVVAQADTSLLVTMRVSPGGNNDPVIDAAYAFLDDLIGVGAPDLDAAQDPPKSGTA